MAENEKARAEKSPPADENQKAADRAAALSDEKQKQLREEGVADAPATGGAVKRMQAVHGVTVEREEGETPSDALKRQNAETVGEDVGEADAASVESGALMETGVKQKVVEQLGHPAVDNRPRLGLPPESNQIDFNDPRV